MYAQNAREQVLVLNKTLLNSRKCCCLIWKRSWLGRLLYPHVSI